MTLPDCPVTDVSGSVRAPSAYAINRAFLAPGRRCKRVARFRRCKPLLPHHGTKWGLAGDGFEVPVPILDRKLVSHLRSRLGIRGERQADQPGVHGPVMTLPDCPVTDVPGSERANPPGRLTGRSWPPGGNARGPLGSGARTASPAHGTKWGLAGDGFEVPVPILDTKRNLLRQVHRAQHAKHRGRPSRSSSNGDTPVITRKCSYFQNLQYQAHLNLPKPPRLTKTSKPDTCTNTVTRTTTQSSHA